jgi:selenocysteine lyase/cysteine desulfurase
VPGARCWVLECWVHYERRSHQHEASAPSTKHQALSTKDQAPRTKDQAPSTSSRHRWVINKMRALMSWYSKGLHNGGHLRTAINAATSISQARDIIEQFFGIVETATLSALRQ